MTFNEIFPVGYYTDQRIECDYLAEEAESALSAETGSFIVYAFQIYIF